MAEGWARALKADCIEAYSAGVDPHGMNERAIQVMAECGIDISRQHSKHIDELHGILFDYVITVCDHAHETCPVLPGARTIHVGFDDPPRLANNATTEEEVLNHYRRVRDAIKHFVEHLPDHLEKEIK